MASIIIVNDRQQNLQDRHEAPSPVKTALMACFSHAVNYNNNLIDSQDNTNKKSETSKADPLELDVVMSLAPSIASKDELSKLEFLQHNFSQLARVFAQKWLGIGRWSEHKTVVARSATTYIVNIHQDNHYKTSQKVAAVFRMSVLFPITLAALIIKIADYGLNYQRWLFLAKLTKNDNVEELKLSQRRWPKVKSMAIVSQNAAKTATR